MMIVNSNLGSTFFLSGVFFCVCVCVFVFVFFLNGYVEYKLALRIQTNYNIYFVCFVQVLLFVFSLSERNGTKYVN